MEHSVTKELGKFFAAGSSDELELMRVVEYASSGEAMDVRGVGEVVAEGMDGEDDASTPIGQSSLFAEPVLQGVGDEVAELGEAFGLFAKDVAQDSGDGENPVPVRDRKADFVANEGGSIEGAALVATWAAAPALASKGEQIVVIAVRTLHAEKATGEVAASQAVTEGRLARGFERAEVFGAIRVIARSEGFE
jgi:hypothetical protein